MQRLTDLSAIARRLPARPTLVLHSGCSEPRTLIARLAEASSHFAGARVYTLMPMGEAPYAELPASAHFEVTTFFPGKGLRAAVTAGRAQTLRHSLSQVPGLFDRGEIRVHAVFLQVSPPDAQGRVSLGLAVDYMHAVLRQKPLVIAQINPCLPRTHGDAALDVRDIDYFIEASEAPQAVDPATGDDVDERIANNVAGLIEDGAVLQVGIGSLPDRVLGRLGNHRDLGLHSGIITDAVQPLMESGVINNRTKRGFCGISVTTMAAGTQRLYEFLDDNAAIEFHPCSLTHDVETLSRIDGLTAVNSALQVDLAGRVNAEAVAGRIISAPGGLPDFARGASRAPRGSSIVAVRACFKERSNIVSRLAEDVPVTIDGEYIDYVVTEFGVADLRERSGRQCAQALIDVAHPSHQERLQRELSMGTL
jgi:4-hydroxybutyrate CoA-transferase